MSVKFEKDTIRTSGVPAPSLKSGKHELADEIGTALTGGKGNVGQPGYLAVREVLSGIVSHADSLLCRPTSSNSSRTLCALRC